MAVNLSNGIALLTRYLRIYEGEGADELNLLNWEFSWLLFAKLQNVLIYTVTNFQQIIPEIVGMIAIWIWEVWWICLSRILHQFILVIKISVWLHRKRLIIFHILAYLSLIHVVHVRKCTCIFIPLINTLWPSDAMWRHISGLTLAQVMACCLTAPSHYLNHRSPVDSPHKGLWRGVLFFFDMNKRLSKQPRRWWFETPSRSLWRHCNDFEPITMS